MDGRIDEVKGVDPGSPSLDRRAPARATVLVPEEELRELLQGPLGIAERGLPAMYEASRRFLRATLTRMEVRIG